MVRRWSGVLVAAGLLVVAAGCGDKETTGEGKGKAKFTIAVIPKARAFRFWPAVIEGAKAAAKEFRVETDVQAAQDENAFTEQIAIVEAMITKEVDGIVLAPLGADTLAPVVDKAHEAGIPVVIIDSGINTKNIVSFVATNNYEGGVMGAERLAKIIGGKGKVALIMNIQGSASTEEREKGFLDTIAKYPNLEVGDRRQYAKGDPAIANQVVTDILTANEDLAGIFAVNEPGAEGALLAVKNKGLVGKVKIVGFDASDLLIGGIRDGTLDSTIVQAPYEMGYKGVQFLVDKLNGKPVPAKWNTPIELVTRDNIDSEEIQRHLAGYKDIRELQKEPEGEPRKE